MRPSFATIILVLRPRLRRHLPSSCPAILLDLLSSCSALLWDGSPNLVEGRGPPGSCIPAINACFFGGGGGGRNTGPGAPSSQCKVVGNPCPHPLILKINAVDCWVVMCGICKPFFCNKITHLLPAPGPACMFGSATPQHSPAGLRDSFLLFPFPRMLERNLSSPSVWKRECKLAFQGVCVCVCDSAVHFVAQEHLLPSCSGKAQQWAPPGF